MRSPKLPGFVPPNRVEYTVINLDGLADFDAASVVDPAVLRSRGLVRKKGPVKVLGRGEISKALKVKAHAFSATAVSKIKAAGGSVEVL
jgi:large subunit ribosomal protein L15